MESPDGFKSKEIGLQNHLSTLFSFTMNIMVDLVSVFVKPTIR